MDRLFDSSSRFLFGITLILMAVVVAVQYFILRIP
jgi:hypothetical protein